MGHSAGHPKRPVVQEEVRSSGRRGWVAPVLTHQLAEPGGGWIVIYYREPRPRGWEVSNLLCNLWAYIRAHGLWDACPPAALLPLRMKVAVVSPQAQSQWALLTTPRCPLPAGARQPTAPLVVLLGKRQVVGGSVPQSGREVQWVCAPPQKQAPC